MRRWRNRATGTALAAVLTTGCTTLSTAVEPTKTTTTDAVTTTGAITTDAVTTTGAITTTDATVEPPKLRDLPAPDLPEDLRYVFQRRVTTDTALGSDAVPRWKILLGLPDDEDVSLLSSDGDWLYAQPMVSPDGRFLSVTGWKAEAAGGRDMAIFIADISDLHNFRRVETEFVRFACPRWTPDGQSMTVTREVASDDWRVSAIDIRSGAVRDVLDASFGADDYPCGVLVDDNTYLYHGLNPATDVVGVRRWNLETSEVDPIIELVGCNTVNPVPRPNTDQIAVTSRCTDDSRSGLRLVSLADGSLEWVVNGLVGVPTWSPDGEWILFSHAIDPQSAEDETTDLWIARADGSEATRLQDAYAAWPSWLPAELNCPDCPGA